MTMLAGVGAKLGAFATQRVVQIAAAGVLSGAVAGTAAVVAGVNPLGPPARGSTVSLLACPGSGAELARVPEGQTMLVVARSVDGHWLEVYIGQPGIDRAWVPAKGVKLQEAGDSLPVDDCVETAAALPSAAPLDTFAPDQSIPAVVTAGPPTPTLPPGVTPAPTPRPTPTPTLKPGQTPPPTPKVTPLPPPPTIPPATPTPTPVPTPVPDTTPPSIFGVSITGAYYDTTSGNYYIYNVGSGCGPTSATITINVTDSGSGVYAPSVTLHWVDPNGVQHNFQMTNPSTGVFKSTITDGSTTWPDSVISYWVTASDVAGNSASTTHPPDNSHWLFKGSCIP